MPDLSTTPMPLEPHTVVKVTKEIPLWALITCIGAFAGQGVAVYYGQVRQGEKITEMTTELRAVVSKLNDNAVKAATVEYQVNDLQRRVTALESDRRASGR